MVVNFSVLESIISKSTHDKPCKLSGVTPASAAYIVLRHLQKNPSPLVIITENDDLAQQLVSDLNSLLQVVPVECEGILYFPSWETSPYGPIAPSIRTRIQRAASLSRLATKPTPSITVTSTRSLFQTIPSAESIRSQSFQIKVGQSIQSQDDLRFQLHKAGYLRVETVEDPGTFSMRGEIIDLFPVGLELPIRIELFDTLLERIRTFDPESQRVTPQDKSLESVLIGPAREVIIHSHTAQTLSASIKEHCDNLGISRAIRDPIVEDVKNFIYPSFSDFWSPFAYPGKTEILIDFITPETKLVFVNKPFLFADFEKFLEEAGKEERETISKGTVVPHLKDLFAYDKSTLEKIEKRTLIEFESLSVNDSEDNPSLRIEILNNSDFKIDPQHPIQSLKERLQQWTQEKQKIGVFSGTLTQIERIRFLMSEAGIESRINQFETGHVGLISSSLSAGFRWPDEKIVILSDHELLGTKKPSSTSAKKSKKGWLGIQSLSDLHTDDIVVHIQHGIAKYQGLTRVEANGVLSDFLLLTYASGDKLYVPVYRLNEVQKYSGPSDTAPLDRLGTKNFEKTKAKVKDSIKKLAFSLVELYAKRSLQQGAILNAPESDFREFEAKFPYDETPDQLEAISSSIKDLSSGTVMDRLICGDVGFGKTEVAMRAAFQAVANGTQVCVLVPTTILAAQHEQSFRTRFQEYPFNIESLSRFKSKKQQSEILENTKAGKVDVIIGTHRLLSKDVHFKELGLIIVDEEHRFGVEHKEKLKTLKLNTHVLTLTATPIPRTLHMALSGLRDISLITTPPVERLPIRTLVSEFNEDLIKRSIETELQRGGQVFFVHNRVQSIHKIAGKISELVPEAKIAVAHGQMNESELEKKMLEFYNKKANVLVSTAIIESGLDIPSANTIIINRSDQLGLAQLYQLRGRVGRGQQRAYAYLLVPSLNTLTADAKKRLEVIQKFVELGSGFQIASHDLEIRGGGNILGPEQSGQVAAVGLELYTELLDEAIQEIRNGSEEVQQKMSEPEIRVPFPSYLSEDYVPDTRQRLILYRKLSGSQDEKEVLDIEDELRDRYGNLPKEAQNLIWIIRIKQLLKAFRIQGLTQGPSKVSLFLAPETLLNIKKVVELATLQPKEYQITPDGKFVAPLKALTASELYLETEKLLSNQVGKRDHL